MKTIYQVVNKQIAILDVELTDGTKFQMEYEPNCVLNSDDVIIQYDITKSVQNIFHLYVVTSIGNTLYRGELIKSIKINRVLNNWVNFVIKKSWLSGTTFNELN